jgi:hypothetical protein
MIKRLFIFVYLFTGIIIHVSCSRKGINQDVIIPPKDELHAQAMQESLIPLKIQVNLA